MNYNLQLVHWLVKSHNAVQNAKPIPTAVWDQFAATIYATQNPVQYFAQEMIRAIRDLLVSVIE